MNSLTVKILTGLLSVLIITTIGSQIYSALTERHDTEEAVLVTINEDIAFKGVVIRDEKVVTYDGGGVLDYTYSDGSNIRSFSHILLRIISLSLQKQERICPL